MTGPLSYFIPILLRLAPEAEAGEFDAERETRSALRGRSGTQPRPMREVTFSVRPRGSAVAGREFPVVIRISNTSARVISFAMLPAKVRITFSCHAPPGRYREKVTFYETLLHDANATYNDGDLYCENSSNPSMPRIRRGDIVSLPPTGVLERREVLDLARVPPGFLTASFEFRLLRTDTDPGSDCAKPAFRRGSARIVRRVVAGGPVSFWANPPLLGGCVRGHGRGGEKAVVVETQKGESRAGGVSCPVGGPTTGSHQR